MRKWLIICLSMVLFLSCFPLEAAVVRAESDTYISDVPENDGVRNAILNAEQLASISFTPLTNLPQKAGDWLAGKEQTGLPYSSSRVEEGFVPNFVSLYTFMSALQNPNSYLYTVDLAEAYNNANGSTYYGTVCSTFCTYALNIVPNYTTHQWQDIPGMEYVPQQTVDALKLGDTICHKTSGHVVMVVGITRNSLGHVGEITIAEAATTRAMVREPYTAEEFSSKYATDVYSYHRYANIHEVEYIPYEITNYNTALIPRKGDKANWLAGIPVEIDLLEKHRYTFAEVYKDDILYDTICVEGERKPIDYTIYLREWYLQYGSNNRLTNRAIPIKGDVRVAVDTGAQASFVFFDSLQQKIGSTYGWCSGEVSINEIAPEGAALFQPIIRLDDNTEITDLTAVGEMVSIRITENSSEFPIQFDNNSISSSHGGVVNNNMRCRSAFLPLQDITINADENVQYSVYYYDADKKYLSNSGTWLDGAKNVLDGKPIGAAYFRLVIKNVDNSVIDANSYGIYAAKVSATIHGGMPEGGMDVLVLSNLEAGHYKARMTDGARHSDWCYWIVVDAVSTATATGNDREASVTFSASNAEPLFVKWAGGVDNGTKHINVLTDTEKAAGAAVVKYETAFNDGQKDTYKIRVAFQTEYGIIHTPLQEAISVSHIYDHPCDAVCNHCGVVRVPAEHVYDNICDTECNVCGFVREMDIPIDYEGNSVSEEKNGLAFRFKVTATGVAVVNDTTVADLTAACIDDFKLVKMGAIVSNSHSSIDVEAIYLCEIAEDTAFFAVRIINIPDKNKEDEITAVPYIVLEKNGEQFILEGAAQIASYSGVLNRLLV